MLNKLQLRNILIIFSVFLISGNLFSLHIHPYRMYFHDLMVNYFARQPIMSVRIPKSVVVPFGLIIVIVMQTLNHFIAYPTEMIFPVLYLICLALAMTCGATIAMQDQGLDMLAKVMATSFIVIGLISVAFQAVQLLNLETMPWIVMLDWSRPLRPFANFAQPNTLALMLCFAVASLWYVFVMGRIRPIWAVLFAVLLLWGLALTQSRIGWIILPLFMVFMWSKHSQFIVIPRFAILALLILFVGFVLTTPDCLHLLGALSEPTGERAGQTSARLVFWRQAWNMSITHPWFGVGWFQFGRYQFLSAAAFGPNNEYSDFAHNIILNFAAETGWPVTLLLIAGCIFWIRRCCVKQWGSLQVRFISLILIAVGMHSMVEFPLWYGHILVPVGIMVGALHTERADWKTIRIGSTWFAGISVAGAVLMGVISWDYSRVVSGFEAMNLIQTGENTAVRRIKKPKWTLFPQYFDYFHIIEIEIKPGMPPQDLAFLEHITTRFAFSPILIRLSTAYMLNNRPDDALHMLITLNRLDSARYVNVYNHWRALARDNQAFYGSVFRRMPAPESTTVPEEK